MDWTAIGSIGTGLAVVVSVTTLIWQSRMARFSIGVDLLMKLDEKFDSNDFRRSRAEATRYLQTQNSEDLVGRRAVVSILNFFEMMGYLLSRGAIENKAVWHAFSYWIFGYHYLCRDLIEKEQNSNRTVYKEFCQLYNVVLAIERRELGNVSIDSIVNDETAAELLDFESRIYDLPAQISYGSPPLVRTDLGESTTGGPQL